MNLDRSRALRIALIAFSLAGAGHCYGDVVYSGMELYPLDPSFTWDFPSVGFASGGQVAGTLNGQAFVYNLFGKAIDLSTSTGLAGSYAYGTDGAYQAGYGYGPDGPIHAFLWHGSAGTIVDLNPAGWSKSVAFGTYRSGQQVGYANQPGVWEHAFLWSGSAASAVDLNPSFGSGSEARGTDGTHQVGVIYVPLTTGTFPHAFLWGGSAASAVDLSPTAEFYSYAVGVAGSQQVGYGAQPAQPYYHAMLWTGSAASAVDLNPVGATDSYAFGTNGTRQVGSADFSGVHNAALWSGSAASYVDLEASLPANFTSSVASSIDGNGNVYGVAYDTTRNAYDAVEWTPMDVTLPEPGSVAMIILGLVPLLRRRAGRHGAEGADAPKQAH